MENKLKCVNCGKEITIMDIGKLCDDCFCNGEEGDYNDYDD